MLSLTELLAAIRPLAEEAGRATLAFYGDKAGVREKADGSPVTLADEAAEAVILPALRALTPEIPVVSEEEVAQGIGPASVGARFWLVDPLDGTKEFLSGNGEFTVNIALIADGRPVLGVVVAPALGETYAGTEGEAYLVDANGERKILCRRPPQEGETVVGSRSHGDASAMEAFLKDRKVAAFRAAGSSLKLCLIARGEADLYPRLGTTMEWDIAAGHAVLAAAGGGVTTVDGGPFVYGKLDFRNPHFVAHGAAGV
ncbi:3'(2'),5'-bisphosphate nucleotidase CysQ [Acidisoma cellulosilytica]|uniref:3'(2'),5'-bisphosphate nucleotidase CysQ n=1 Tax=Acidisoma cellulosilyticum TaxID=2802395 RepID=A0A963YX74_9PROT|nr:3'(2'),5'-bisphosphate nucleotidase CysQ [Acidisoma cellulosilyticum]